MATCSGWREKNFLTSSSWPDSGNGRPSFGVRLGWGFSNGSHGDVQGFSRRHDEAESTSAFPHHTSSATTGRIFQGFSRRRASERRDSHDEQGNHFSFAKAVVSVLPLAECTEL